MLSLNRLSIIKGNSCRFINHITILNSGNKFYSRRVTEVVIGDSGDNGDNEPNSKSFKNIFKKTNNNNNNIDNKIDNNNNKTNNINKDNKFTKNIKVNNSNNNYNNNNNNNNNKRNDDDLYESNNTLKVKPKNTTINKTNRPTTTPVTNTTTTTTTIQNIKRNNEENIVKNEFGLKNFHKDIQKVLNGMGIEKATIIQQKSIPVLQSGVDCYVIDETGTGKSFGVMCEIINRYYKDIILSSTTSNNEVQQPTTTEKQKESIKPKFIIISPTRELAWQFGYWCRDLLGKLPILDNNQSEESKSKVQLAVNSLSEELLKKQLLASDPNILIGTSNILYPMVVNGFIDLSNLNLLFIDEADQIFQSLKADVNLKQKKIRAIHPLPSTLLFNEIKRRAREQNQLQKESFDEKVLKIIKQQQQQQQQQSSNNEIPIKPKYIKTMRPFQTVFSSATIGYTTKKEIKDRDWINSNAQFISALDDNKVQAIDTRLINEDDELQQPLRNQLSIINRLQHYFISVDSENQMLNGIVDVWKSLKPKIAIGILPNDGNISKVVDALLKRNVNCLPLSSIMDFQKFNLIHLPNEQEQQTLLKLVENESKEKELETRQQIRKREKNREIELKKQKKLQQQQQAKDDASTTTTTNKEIMDVDDELFQIVNQEWKLDTLDKQSILYLAKEDSIRGIDIENISHVFILNVIVKPSSYLHMIGRTARMGKSGNVVCIYNSSISSKYLNTMNQLNIPFKEEDLY